MLAGCGSVVTANEYLCSIFWGSKNMRSNLLSPQYIINVGINCVEEAPDQPNSTIPVNDSSPATNDRCF
jgi:hypothetical protein